MNIRVCVPVMAKTVSSLIPLIERAEALGADIVEVRLDYLDRLEGIAELPEHTSVPLIATNRQHEQGGFRPQDEETRLGTLVEAAEAGFRYVDVELTARGAEAAVSKVRDAGAEPIVSYHDLIRTPKITEMEEIVEREIDAGAEVCKLVTTAKDASDSVVCLLLNLMFSEETKIVCFAMGEGGILSRVLAPVFGAYFTYASLREGLETAPGQISITELRETYSKLRVGTR